MFLHLVKGLVHVQGKLENIPYHLQQYFNCICFVISPCHFFYKIWIAIQILAHNTNTIHARATLAKYLSFLDIRMTHYVGIFL